VSELPQPVHEVLDPSVDEESVYRVWRNVGRARVMAWRRQERGPRRQWAVAGAGLAAAAAVGMAIWGVASGTGGPLRTVDGDRPGVLVAARDVPGRTLRFDDGSRILVEPGARLETTHNDARRFEARLARGRVDVHVEPDGPRRWRVDAGLAVVDVLGTRFVVERVPSRVRVEVLRGHVIVRDRLRDRRLELTAGDSVVVERDPPEPSVTPDTDGDGDGAASADADPPEAPRAGAHTRLRVEREAWRDLARRGQYDRAWDSLGRDGLDRASRNATADSLLQLADVARLSGHAEEAVAPLERFLREHPSDGRAGLAAFTLGVVHMDQRGAPGQAAEAFERALELDLPEPLREDALARLSAARGRAGDAEGAARAARRYLDRHPEGPRAPDVRRRLDGQ